MKIINKFALVASLSATLCVPCYALCSGMPKLASKSKFKVEFCAAPETNGYAYNGWELRKTDMEKAWDIEKGSSSVKVGIIDSGIDGKHPALTKRIDSSLSIDFTGGQSPLTDEADHGTMVAGIIGADVENNDDAVPGVCWEGVTLISYKVAQGNDTAQVTNAIYSAKSAGIPLLNISLNVVADDNLKNAIQNYPGLIVCAAGNGETNIDGNGSLASLPYDNILVVGGSNYADAVSDISNYGPTAVDLFAPCERIYNTKANGLYDQDDGTSFATPLVTGVAALLLSKYSYLKTAELKASIMQNVTVISSMMEKSVSGGRLNAYKAITNYVHTHTYNFVPIMTRSGLNEAVSPLAIGTNFDMVSHTAVCTACKHRKKENHSWVTVNGKYTCKCGVSSSTIPITPEY